MKRLPRQATLAAVAMVVSLAVLQPTAASTGTRTFTGTVSASGTSWRSHTFDVQAPATIAATLDWTNATANLNLFLYDPSGVLVVSKASMTAKPETLSYEASASGSWRIGVKAKSGSSDYSVTVDGAAPPEPSYVTILLGRTQWVAAQQCVPLANAVDLGQVAAALNSRGLAATGNVVVDRTLETSMHCEKGYALHPSWAQLAELRDTYGWTFISAGATYAIMTNLTRQQQFAESCGSLEAFEAHGHQRAWGLFAYPGNAYSTDIQSQVVSTCFSYGRKYSGKVSSRSTMQAPWFQNTYSVNGGACSDPSQDCYSTSWVGVNRRYVTPSQLFDRTTPRSAEWASIQFYRFVKGSKLSGAQRWDCSATDPSKHWTNRAETYCWTDFLTYVDGLPSDVIVTDPASVAEEWGRAPG